MESEIWLHKKSGQWCRTLAGRRYYFGKDYTKAIARYARKWPFIERGLPVPSIGTGGITVGQVLNYWLDDRLKDAIAGKIKQATWADYQNIARFAADHLHRETKVAALSPATFADLRRAFEAGYTKSPTVLSRAVTVTRMAFRCGVRTRIG